MTISHNIVLIPAYEPGPSLLELLRDLSDYSCDHNGDRDHDSSHNLSGSHAHDTSIIVVDDGSGPDYATIFDEARSFATVLTHKENRGKGAALKTGLSYIEKSSGEKHFDPDAVIVTMDADGQHRTEDAMKICAVARTHPDALVLGGRRFTGKIRISCPGCSRSPATDMNMK